MTKKCITCQLDMPLNDFYCYRQKYRQSSCKTCMKRLQAERTHAAKDLDHKAMLVWIERILNRLGWINSSGKRSHLISLELRRKLKYQLYQQFINNPFCPLTGVRLIPTINASVDHIHSMSEYPTLAGDINNMRWISKDANRARGTMSDEQFISFCRLVVNHTSKTLLIE